MYDATRIDPGSDSTTVAEQHPLLERLAQLADTHDRTGWADDHVLNVLLRRYDEVRCQQYDTLRRGA
jgi:hypothetical protein